LLAIPIKKIRYNISMKPIRIFTIIFAFVTLSIAKIPVVVSILPQKTFAEAIGGEWVSVQVMVQPGQSPHTYEPKPSQMKQIARAKLYLAIGVEFESVWLPKFRDLNPALRIVDVSEGITRRAMREKQTAKTRALDPHIWTTPANVRIIARNTLAALQKADPAHAETFEANYTSFVASLDRLDRQLHTLLDPLKGSAFMVMHPTWGYFADAYGLKQLPARLAGKSLKPRDLIALIRQAHTARVRAVFALPEFSDTMAKVLADELGVPVIKISPMATDWVENLLRLARAIAQGEMHR
jgi:zinc transport system substrate-binding protein